MPDVTILDHATGEKIPVHYEGDGPLTDDDIDDILKAHEASRQSGPAVPLAAKPSPVNVHHVMLLSRGRESDALGLGMNALLQPDTTPGLLQNGLLKPDATLPVSPLPNAPAIPLSSTVAPVVNSAALPPDTVNIGGGHKLTGVWNVSPDGPPVIGRALEPAEVADFMDKADAGDKQAAEVVAGQLPELVQAAQEFRDNARLAQNPESAGSETLAALSASVRNFAQGTILPGLRRNDAAYNQAAEQGRPAPSPGVLAQNVFTDVPDNVRSGFDAAVNNTGPAQIGAIVPSLAPDTTAGKVYNGLTAAGSDPLNFAVPGLGETVVLPKLRLSPEQLQHLLKTAPAKQGVRFVPPVSAPPVVSPPREILPPVVPARPAVSLPPAPPAAASRLASREVAPGVYGYTPPAGSSLDGAPALPSVAPAYPRLTPEPSPLIAGATNAAPLSPAGKVFSAAVKGAKTGVKVARAVNNVARAVDYGHLPLPMRNGLVLGVSRPVQGAKAYAAGIHAFASEEAAQRVSRAIRNSPNAELYKTHGLSLPIQEEGFTHTAERLPLVGGVFKRSSRAASTYLNSLRQSAFDTTLAAWRRGGMEPKPEDLDALAKYINAASGRGDLGKLEKHAQILTDVFASPRYQASRAQLLNPVAWAKQPAAVRNLQARDMAAVLGSQAALLALAKANGATVETDLRSSDFGKAKWGKTRIDFSSGLNSYIRFAVAEALNEHKTEGGKIKEAGRLATAGRFLEERLSPLPGAVVDFARGTDLMGHETNVHDETYKKSTMMLIGEVRDAIKENGAAKGALLSLAAVPGASVQTYPTEGNLWTDTEGALGLPFGPVGTLPDGRQGVVEQGEGGSHFIRVPPLPPVSRGRESVSGVVRPPVLPPIPLAANASTRAWNGSAPPHYSTRQPLHNAALTQERTDAGQFNGPVHTPVNPPILPRPRPRQLSKKR